MNRARADVTEIVAKRLKKKPKYVSDKDIDNDDVIKRLKQLRKTPVHTAMLEGSYSDQLIRIKNKHKKYGVDDYGSNVLSICSWDGSQHANTVLKKVNIITGCTQLFSKTLQDKGLTTSNSDNILTTSP